MAIKLRHLTRTERHMLETLLPDYHSPPVYSWVELEPLIKAGYIERVGFTPMLTNKGLVALCGAPGGVIKETSNAE